MKKIFLYVLAITAAIIGVQSCSTYHFRSNYKDANRLIYETDNLRTKPFLKAHLKNGDVCILKDSWKIDTALNMVTGYGTQFDFNRKQTFDGSINISIDSVAIFETNTKILHPEANRITALSLMAGLDVAIGIICLANPKACFGSCPTFYLNENDNFHYADAEGFSNAISPSLEYFDIDALNHKLITDNTLSIIMKNEALETHCVKDVKILAYPLKEGERVFHSPTDDFFLCENLYMLKQAEGEEGDITDYLKHDDRLERFSLSDSNDLSSKEEIYLTFDNVENTNNLGFVISFRQTLMTTYFIYSAMGYMGDEVGDFFAKIETDEKINAKLGIGIKEELGDIDIYIWNNQKNDWEFQDGFYETGPIAMNRQLIPLKNSYSGSEIKAKMVLNKGLWRIDHVALTNIKDKVIPLELSPSSVYNKGKIDCTALSQIKSSDEYLVSMPGSEYKFNFMFPGANTYYELFLYSKGYYLEWMREQWIKDKDLLKLKKLLDNPKKYLRDEVKAYKLYENTMEQEFWNSRIDTKTFSYYEK